MRMRIRTIMSLASAGLAVAVLGTVAITQLRRPEAAQARSPEPAVSAPALPERAGAPLTLDTFRNIARVASPGVVNVNTKKVVKRQAAPDPFRDFFGEGWSPFGDRGGPQALRSLGSGFVIDKDGYILTNRHVVEGADEIQVTLQGGRKTYDAKIIGKDARTDVALIKIEPRETLTVLPMGDSDRAEAGEWVMAIGSPFQLAGTVTVGVVSYAGRSVPLESSSEEMIQTDAPINPGNSGGPLLNTRGEVIGINTLIYSQGAAQSSGVGFAVPINVARGILPQLKEKGSVTRGWLGVSIKDLDEDMAATYKLKEAKGAVINEVTPGSPADKAGVQPEDIVLGVDEKQIEQSSELVRYVSSRAPGTSVRLRVLHKGVEKTFTIALGTFPEERERQAGGEGDKDQLGMTYQDLTPGLADRLDLPRGSDGVVVTAVEPGGAADDADLQRGDVIVSVNSESVASADQFARAIEKARQEKRARLRVVRQRGAFITVIKLE